MELSEIPHGHLELAFIRNLAILQREGVEQNPIY